MADPDDTMCAGEFLDWAGSPDVFFVVHVPTVTAYHHPITLCDAASYDTSLWCIYLGGL